MNYAFKMMAVTLLTFGMSGCAEYIVAEAVIATINAANNSSSYVGKEYKPVLSRESDNRVCAVATANHKGTWNTSDKHGYVQEAKRRGLDCGVKGNSNKTIMASKAKKQNYTQWNYYGNSLANQISKASDISVCNFVKENGDYAPFWKTEAKRRVLDCGINESGNKTLANAKKSTTSELKSNAEICNLVTETDYNTLKKSWKTPYNNSMFTVIRPYLSIAKRRGLDCGVNENKTVIASKTKAQTYKSKSNVSSAELDAERQKRKKLEQELAKLRNNQQEQQQRITSDNQEPIINAFSKKNGSNAIISGRVTDNTEVAEVLIDGQAQKVSSSGTFETELYIPRNGLNVEIVAYDRKGNKASKLLKIERGNVQQASGPIFDKLNPTGKRVKSNPNALALIIGVADYSRTNANALYADKDAQQFYDYARMKLGIPSSNIKELVNAKADRVEITLAVKDWIARSTKLGKTDIYVFFAGHGLSTADGKDMFLLPYDGLPRLLQDSAIKRDQLFADIQKANPKSVTVFLDTCYSGTTRGTDMLVASRPIAIRALEQSIPSNFTVFSAAAGDQTSKPLEEAKHGMFSYFLMKGMEGDADSNNDKKITARELHAYVEQNVTQQSSGSQTPELQGDKDRVLVQFN